jgi:hypothetical protein
MRSVDLINPGSKFSVEKAREYKRALEALKKFDDSNSSKKKKRGRNKVISTFAVSSYFGTALMKLGYVNSKARYEKRWTIPAITDDVVYNVYMEANILAAKVRFARFKNLTNKQPVVNSDTKAISKKAEVKLGLVRRFLKWIW